MASHTDGPTEGGSAPNLARADRWGRVGAAIAATALAVSYLSVYTTLGPIGAGQNPATIQTEILVYIFSVGVLVTAITAGAISLRRVTDPERRFSLLEFLLSATLLVVVPLLFVFSVLVGLLLATAGFGPAQSFGVPLAAVVGDRFTYAIITFLMVGSGMAWGIAMGSVRFRQR